ncbi:MAG: ECF-type sigma factor [Isosphaeraceae bacterium]
MTDDTHDFQPVGSLDAHLAEDLLPMVYDELRRLAAIELGRESPGQTLQPTALVHEAYLRLSRQSENKLWDNPGHFFSAAAEAMRRILIERARAKRCKKRGGERSRLDFEPTRIALPEAHEELLALDESLTRLGRSHPRLADLVKLRYFAGLTIKEAADALGVSPRTADSDWAYARAWLLADLSEGDPSAADVTRGVE